MKKKRSLVKWLIFVSVFVLLLLALFLPLPYYIEMPGGAYDIRSVLTVDKKRIKKKGPIILLLLVWLKQRQ